jgi:putative addiction module component (TIGR02574 family)
MILIHLAFATVIGIDHAIKSLHNRHMNTISIPSILALPVAERIRLAELIWDSVADTPEAMAISPEQQADLQTRLQAFEAAPEAGYTWDQVKAHLKDGSWRTV